jgi:hypothetical protein
MTPYSARPNSLMRLRASTVTSEKMRLSDINVSAMLDRHKRRISTHDRAMGTTALEVVDKRQICRENAPATHSGLGGITVCRARSIRLLWSWASA